MAVQNKTTALKTEFEYYQKNKHKLIEKYEGKEIVIVGTKVIGADKDFKTALDATKKTHKLGTFMVKHVVKGDDTIYFKPRVYTKS